MKKFKIDILYAETTMKRPAEERVFIIHSVILSSLLNIIWELKLPNYISWNTLLIQMLLQWKNSESAHFIYL